MPQPDIPGLVVMGGASGAIPPDAIPGGVAMGGGVAIGAMEAVPEPESPADPSNAGYFEEYRFVRPVKYSGYRFVHPEFATEDTFPRDWRIVVDCVDHITGER